MNRKIGVILSYVMMVFEVLSTLLLTPFIVRTLGQAEYGVYKLSAAIVAYLLLLDLGVGNAVTKYAAQYRVEGDVQQSRRFLGGIYDILFHYCLNSFGGWWGSCCDFSNGFCHRTYII